MKSSLLSWHLKNSFHRSKAILSPLLAAIRTWTSFWLRDWKKRKNEFVQFVFLLALYIGDLIVLHSGTLFVVTFADAKVVKHVEPVKLEMWSKYIFRQIYFLTNSWTNMECLNNTIHTITVVITCTPWQAPGRTWFLWRCCLLHQGVETTWQIPSRSGQSPILQWYK